MPNTCRSLARTPLTLAVFALFLVYLSLMSGQLHSIDGLTMYREAQSMVFTHSLHFDFPLWPDSPLVTSKYGIGLSLLYVPGVLLSRLFAPSSTPLVGSQPWDTHLFYSDPVYPFAGAPVHILVTVASAYMVALLIRELGFGRSLQLWGFFLYGLASPALVYARGDYGQTLEGLCWIWAIYSVIRFRRLDRSSYLWLASLLVAFAVLTRLVEGFLLFGAIILYLAPNLHYRTWTRPTLNAVASVSCGFAVALVIALLINHLRYGSIFRTGYEGESWTTLLPVGLAGSLVSPGRGLIWEFPAVVMIPLGMQKLFSLGQKRIALVLCGLAFVQLLNVAAWSMWWGGWNWGLRLFVPALPLVAVLGVCGISALTGQARRWLPWLFMTLGAAWAVSCAVTDLYGGYATTFDGTSAAFRVDAYPPIAVWTFLHHLYPLTFDDSHAVDVLWFRLAAQTNYLTLLVPAICLLGAVALGIRAVSMQGDGAASLAGDNQPLATPAR